MFRILVNFVPLEKIFSIINLFHTKLYNRIKTDYIDKLQLIYIDSQVFKRVDVKRLELNKILLNLTSNQEIELENKYLLLPLTFSNILKKWLKDNKEKKEDYLLSSAQPASAC